MDLFTTYYIKWLQLSGGSDRCLCLGCPTEPMFFFLVSLLRRRSCELVLLSRGRVLRIMGQEFLFAGYVYWDFVYYFGVGEGQMGVDKRRYDHDRYRSSRRRWDCQHRRKDHRHLFAIPYSTHPFISRMWDSHLSSPSGLKKLVVNVTSVTNKTATIYDLNHEWKSQLAIYNGDLDSLLCPPGFSMQQ